MAASTFRPSLRIPLSLTREEGIEAVRSRVAAVVPANNWIGKGRWCEIHLPSEEQRIWSPHVSLRLDHEDDGSCSIFARFAPRPEVWTLFVFGYGAVAFLVLLGAVFGYVQWASDEAAWGLWAVWVGTPTLLLFHLASWTGQRLSAGQIETLRGQLHEVLEGLPVRDRSVYRDAAPAGAPPEGGSRG